MIGSFSVHDSEGPATDREDADAEDEVAQAEARVEAARSRLARLRRAAESDDANESDDADEDAAVEQRSTESVRARLRSRRPSRRLRSLRRPGRRAVAAGVGVALASASLAVAGYMLRQHHTLTHKQQLSQEYAAAARQSVITLMSIDANHPKEDIQRIIDASTGPLKDQISVMSSVMLKQAEDAKTTSRVNVEAVAVESATENSGVALVVAKSDVTDAENKQRPPQLWRLTIEIVRDGGQLKMSKVDFLQ